MESLNYDELYEICEKLDDKSLLNMTRTSKEIRNICGRILNKRNFDFYKRLIKLLSEIENITVHGSSWLLSDSLTGKTRHRLKYESKELLISFDLNDKGSEYITEGRHFHNIFIEISWYGDLNGDLLDESKSVFKKLFQEISDDYEDLTERIK